MIKQELTNAYINKDYQKFLKIFTKYLKKGLGVDADMLIQYASVLIYLKKYDEAINILMNLVPDAQKYHFEYSIAWQLFFCSKLDVAEKLMLSILKPNTKDLYLLGKIYILEGKISEAKNCFLEVVKKSTKGKKDYIKAANALRQIENHEKYGAFLKIDYECFINQDNFLKPGHIIYLKHGIEKVNGNIQNEDGKTADRPYMIYKIGGEKISVFAITTNSHHYSRKLAKEDYPNFLCDRYVKDNLLVTSHSNVSSVDSKVNDADFQRIVNSIFKSSYFGNTKQEKEGKKDFFTSYVGEVKPSNIIEFVEPSSKEKHFYFVIDKTESEFKAVEIDLPSLEVLNLVPETIKQSRIIFNVIKLSKPEIEYVLEQLPDSVKYKKVLGAIINYNGQDMIIISETPNEYFCIDTLYSSSYMNLQTISKQELFVIKGFVADEQFAYIKKLVNEKYLNDLQEKSKLGSRRRKRIKFH